MKRYKLYTLIITAILSVANLQAQTLNDNYAEVRAYLNSMFQLLNKNLVPTGILMDFGIELVDVEDYDGTILSDSTFVNVGIYRDILKSVMSAEVKATSPGIHNTIKNRIDALDNVTVDGPIKLSAAFYQYNVIKPNAIDDNLIIYDEANNKVRDAFNDNGWINPYDTKNLFAFAVGAQQSKNLSVQYTLPNGYIFTNASYASLYFDAGDGSGYRACTPNSTISVNYATEGTKILKLKIRTQQGEYLVSHTRISIQRPQSTLSGSGKVYATKDYTSSEFNGQTVSARIVYDPSISPQICKPFIVVEGFDPWELEEISGGNDNAALDNELYPNSNIHSGYNDYSDDSDIYETLHNTFGYDVIYVDWENCTADIRANAYLLQDIIQDINAMKLSAGSDEKNIVLGLSMGGLISRYALRDMELKNEIHDVAAYVSGDTPHLGVNVPIGCQILLNQLLSFIQGFDNTIYIADLFFDNKIQRTENLIKDIITSDAAKQMMYRYANGTSISDDRYNAWQQELQSMGFPQGDPGEGIMLLGMANKSMFGTNSLIDSKYLLSADGYAKSSFISMLLVKLFGSLISTGDRLDEILDFGTILGSNRIDIDVKVSPFCAANIGQTLSKFELTFTKKFLWLFPKTFTIFSSHVYMPTNDLYYEDFPGSRYYINLNTGNGLGHNNSQFIFNWADCGILGGYSLTGGFVDHIMFVPTASALNITNNGEALSAAHYSVNYMATNNPIENTPFHSYYIDNSSDSHIVFGESAYTWIANQVNMTIDGPDVAQGTAQYTVSGLDDLGASISWSVSDNTIANIDDSGNLTILKSGMIDVIATYWNKNGKLYRKTKSVLVEFPNIAITKGYIAGYGYRFTARLVDDYDGVTMNDIISNCNLQCEWTLIDSDGNVITEMTSSNVFEYLPEDDEAVTIIFRLVDSQGNKSELRSVSFNLKTPFSVNYRYVVVNTYGGVFFMKEDGTYDAGMPTDDFTISFKYEIMNDNDNSLTLISQYLKGANCYIDCYNTNSGLGVSFVGTKVSMESQWYFNFFDQSFFVDDIETALNYEGTEREVIAGYDLVIRNNNGEALQRVPFRIIYNPYFGLY